MVPVDIVGERVGPFRIGATFPLPPEVRDASGREFESGDIIFLEPFARVGLVLVVSEDAGRTRRVTVADLKVREGADAILYGRPLRETRISRLLEHLRTVGVTVAFDEDGDLMLSDHAMLRALGDDVEMIWMGGSTNLRRKWDKIVEPRHVEAIIQNATEFGGVSSEST